MATKTTKHCDLCGAEIKSRAQHGTLTVPDIRKQKQKHVGEPEMMPMILLMGFAGQPATRQFDVCLGCCTSLIRSALKPEAFRRMLEEVE